MHFIIKIPPIELVPFGEGIHMKNLRNMLKKYLCVLQFYHGVLEDNEAQKSSHFQFNRIPIISHRFRWKIVKQIFLFMTIFIHTFHERTMKLKCFFDNPPNNLLRLNIR